MIKITKEDATALRYANGELPKEVLVGEYEVTTITPTGQVRKADIYGKDFSSDYYDLIIDESVKTIGRKHTYVKIAIVLVLLFSALFCHSQDKYNRDSLLLPTYHFVIPSKDTASFYKPKYDTVLALICKKVDGSIAHSKIVVIKRTYSIYELFTDLKGRRLGEYFLIRIENLTEDQLKKVRNSN